MKKLFLFSVAALAICACSKDEKIAEVSASNQQKEIKLFAVAQPNTRAAIDGSTFTPTTMMVTAYDATAGANYFGATSFTGSGDSYTGGKYWPFSPGTINFLAIAEANSDNTTGVTWGPTISAVASNPTEKVQIVMGDNSSAQRDLMYACGTGTVSQGVNSALSFPTDVDMTFKHAQAWVKFYVQAANEASEAITINYIRLNSVSCRGTYLVTHANWNETKASRDAADPAGNLDGSVSGAWSEYSTYATNINAVKDGSFTGLDHDAATLPQYYGSLMVVPDQGMASFTINYTLGGNTYDYTYTPASTTLAQATKYTYNITLTLHEIVIDPEVTDWANGGSTAVSM